MQRNGETVLETETGRVGSSEPSQSKSEGSSDCTQKMYQKVNGRSRKRLFH